MTTLDQFITLLPADLVHFCQPFSRQTHASANRKFLHSSPDYVNGHFMTKALPPSTIFQEIGCGTHGFDPTGYNRGQPCYMVPEGGCVVKGLVRATGATARGETMDR